MHIITIQEIQHMREVTGLGMRKCKELLEKYGTIEASLEYLRTIADEPEYTGRIDKSKYDVFENGVIIFSCETMEELKRTKYYRQFPFKYAIRSIDNSGNYFWFK